MTPRSLVIFDEIGRGTSTFDGMSLAQSILEFLVQQKKAMTFFATHYHELTRLSDRFAHLKNAHMSVTEHKGEIRFLHTLTEGPALKSYGIQVARLAGLPTEVTRRASEVLKKIENPDSAKAMAQMSLFEASLAEAQAETRMADADSNANPQMPTAVAGFSPQQAQALRDLADSLRTWPLQSKTPLEALLQIQKWQDMISSRSSDLSH